MTNKRFFIYAVVALLLGSLFYLQFRTWRNFDWAVFLAETPRGAALLHILGGIACTWVAYGMRALRWQIFLRPVKRTTAAKLIAPTIILSEWCEKGEASPVAPIVRKIRDLVRIDDGGCLG